MKSLFIISFITLFCVSAISQTSKTVQVNTAGTLENMVSTSEAKIITSLTVSGNIDARDIAYIRDKFKIISTIDLTNSAIKAFSGTDGTYTGLDTTYKANDLPIYSFYNPFLHTYKSTLTSVKLPSNLVSISDMAFYFCWSLVGQFSIPSTVKSISDYAFYGCYAITAFSVSSANTRYSASNGVLFSKNQDTLFIFPNAKSGNYVIPSTVKRINPSAFENSYNLTSVTIPSSVTSIGSYAFCNCSGITGNLSLPSSLKTLEDGAFYSCYNLSGTVTIPSSLTNMGAYCFFTSNKIQAFSVNSSNPLFSSNNGILYSKNQDSLFICPPAKAGSITIPNTVKLIGSYAFYNCNALTGNLNIPINVDYIGYYSFYGCKNISSFTADGGNQYFSSLENVLYSKNLNRILACPSTKSGQFNLPSTIKYIDPCTFNNCSNLNGFVNIPAVVEYIGDYAFYGCSSISGFTADPDNKYFSATDGLLYNKQKDTLYICPLIKTGTITIPQNVRFIGHSAFDGCVSITEIVLPESVREIGNYAFEYCTALTKANIPGSVEKIGTGSFYSCTGLKELTVELIQPPVIDYYYLELVDKTTCKLIVPINSAGLYRDAPYWDMFTSITEKDFSTNVEMTEKSLLKTFTNSEGIVVHGLRPGSMLEIYNLNGKIIIRRIISDETTSVKLPNKSIYIIKNGDAQTKVAF